MSLVINYHDRARQRLDCGIGRRPGLRVHRACDRWKIDLKRGALTKRALHLNIPAVAFNNAIHARKTESRALALFLSGEKRLKDTRLGLFIHACPCVSDREIQVRTSDNRVRL